MSRRKPGPQPFKPDSKFRKMWNSGVLVKDIAVEFGISPGSVSTAARRAGLEPRKTGRKICFDIRNNEAFKRAWMAGVNSVKIAKAMGVTQGTVSRYAKISGLPQRQRGYCDDGRVLFVGELR